MCSPGMATTEAKMGVSLMEQPFCHVYRILEKAEIKNIVVEDDMKKEESKEICEDFKDAWKDNQIVKRAI